MTASQTTSCFSEQTVFGASKLLHFALHMFLEHTRSWQSSVRPASASAHWIVVQKVHVAPKSQTWQHKKRVEPHHHCAQEPLCQHNMKLPQLALSNRHQHMLLLLLHGSGPCLNTP